MTAKEIKSNLLLAAATLSAGCISNNTAATENDPDISSNETKAENLTAWRLTNIFYHALKTELENSDWADPNLSGQPKPTDPVPDLPGQPEE